MNGSQGHPDTTTAPQTAPETSTAQPSAPQAPAGASYGPFPGAPGQYAPQAQAPQPQARLEDSRRKSPLLACILSIIPGLGQVYVGYYPRGFVHAIVVALLFSVLTTMDFSPVVPLGVVFLVFFWLYNIIDAGRRAAMYNHVLAGGEVQDLPQDIKMPGIGGSIVGGLAIIVLGAIALSNTAYDVPLDWLEDWWPVALLLVGGYLLVKGILERTATRTGEHGQSSD